MLSGRQYASDRAGWLHLDVDATITAITPPTRNASASWKQTFGSTRCWCFDRPEIAAGEALAGMLGQGNAEAMPPGHISVLDQSLASLPAHYRPDPDNPNARKVLIRLDSAGATYGSAAACRTAGAGFLVDRGADPRRGIGAQHRRLVSRR